MIKEVNVNFRTTEKEKKNFMHTARILDISFSQFAREAIREKIIRITKQQPQTSQLQQVESVLTKQQKA